MGHGGGAGRTIARINSSARTCGVWSCSGTVDWLSCKRIYNTVIISRRELEVGIDGCWRITKIQGIKAGSFLEGKLLRPWAV